jgi:hypothetical protein
MADHRGWLNMCTFLINQTFSGQTSAHYLTIERILVLQHESKGQQQSLIVHIFCFRILWSFVHTFSTLLPLYRETSVSEYTWLTTSFESKQLILIQHITQKSWFLSSFPGFTIIPTLQVILGSTVIITMTVSNLRSQNFLTPLSSFPLTMYWIFYEI